MWCEIYTDTDTAHAWGVLFFFIHQNGREKNNNTKRIKSEIKIKANNLTKQIKICKHLQIQFMIYSSINQRISNNNWQRNPTL